MTITDVIAQHIIEVYEGNNWTEVSISETLADVDHKEAVTVTMASDNTIASLLHHLIFYNDVVIQRLSGINPSIGESNGFDTGRIISEDDWKKLKERSKQSYDLLTLAVKRFPDVGIFDLTITGYSTHYTMLHGVAEHAYYHLGQIVLLKNLIRNTKSFSVTSNN